MNTAYGEVHGLSIQLAFVGYLERVEPQYLTGAKVKGPEKSVACLKGKHRIVKLYSWDSGNGTKHDVFDAWLH
jgi:hypothetical protein